MRRRHGNAAAWWALVLTIAGAAAFFPVDGQSANYSHFALLPGAIAVVLARRGRSSTAFLAGLALGVAVLCRQTWIIGLIGGTVGAMVAGRRRDGAWFAAGTAIGIASAALYVPFGGFWHWTFTGNGGFLREGEALGRAVVDYLASLGTFVGFHITLVAAAVVAAIAFARASRRARIEQLDLWLWLGGAIIAEAAGLRFFGHYWIQALPPLVLLTAPLLARATQRVQTWAVIGVAVPTVLAVAAAFTPSTFRTLPNPTPLADYVHTHTPANAPVFVWGSFPEVYWKADRPPGGALVLSDSSRGVREAGPPARRRSRTPLPGPTTSCCAASRMPTRARARHLDGQHPRLRALPIAHFTELADF